MSDKIKISLDDVNAPSVTMKISQNDLMRRAGEHQEQVRRNVEFAGTPPAITSGSGESVFNKPWCYLAIAGLIFGFGGWMVSEIFMQASESMILDILQSSRTPSDEEFGVLFILNILWYMSVCVCLAFGLSSAERFMDGNYSSAATRGAIAAGIALLISPVACIVTEITYASLGGGQLDTPVIVQMFARSLGWAFIGCFVAMAPGILMKSGKKLDSVWQVVPSVGYLVVFCLIQFQ